MSRFFWTKTSCTRKWPMNNQLAALMRWYYFHLTRTIGRYIPTRYGVNLMLSCCGFNFCARVVFFFPRHNACFMDVAITFFDGTSKFTLDKFYSYIKKIFYLVERYFSLLPRVKYLLCSSVHDVVRFCGLYFSFFRCRTSKNRNWLVYKFSG